MKQLIILLLLLNISLGYAQMAPKLDKEFAEKLSMLKLACMDKEYPNKTAHNH
jgi:hypothetical protein